MVDMGIRKAGGWTLIRQFHWWKVSWIYLKLTVLSYFGAHCAGPRAQYSRLQRSVITVGRPPFDQTGAEVSNSGQRNRMSPLLKLNELELRRNSSPEFKTCFSVEKYLNTILGLSLFIA